MKALVHLDGRILFSGSRFELKDFERRLISGGACDIVYEPDPPRQPHRPASALTQRQRDILAWICVSIDVDGYPPTIREISDHFGIRSTNGVNDHLKSIERKGWIKRTAETSRGLKILRRP